MLKSEYDERMGRNSSVEEYEVANSVYMEATDFDKDQFVREWKKVEKNPLVSILIKRMMFWEEGYFELSQDKKKLLDLIEKAKNLFYELKEKDCISSV